MIHYDDEAETDTLLLCLFHKKKKQYLFNSSFRRLANVNCIS